MAGRPTDAPDWATNANFAAGAFDWSGQANKLKPDAGKIADGFDPDEDFYVEWLNWIENNHGQWISFLEASLGSCARGDGSDGDIVLDGVVAAPPGMTKLGTVYTMSRPIFAKSVTVTGAGVQLHLNNLPLFCRGDVTTDHVDAINNNAADTVGQNPPALTGSGVFGGGAAGGVGGTPGVSGGEGTAGANITNSIGGNGGDPSSESKHGTATAPAMVGIYRALSPAMLGFILGMSGGSPALVQLQGGAGGGGGFTSTGMNGGGGGNGAGVAAVIAGRLMLSSATDIRGKGGAGGNPNSGTPIASTAYGAGGGGGGGGLFLAYAYCNQALSSAVNCPGGAGGTAILSPNGTPGANGTLVQFACEADNSASSLVVSSPHVEQGFSAITAGVGAGHEYIDFTWTQPFASATGASGYMVEVQISMTNDGDPIPGIAITNKTPTGFRIRFTTDFDGEVRWSAK